MGNRPYNTMRPLSPLSVVYWSVYKNHNSSTGNEASKRKRSSKALQSNDFYCATVIMFKAWPRSPLQHTVCRWSLLLSKVGAHAKYQGKVRLKVKEEVRKDAAYIYGGIEGIELHKRGVLVEVNGSTLTL